MLGKLDKNMFYKGIAEHLDGCEFRGRNFYMCNCTVPLPLDRGRNFYMCICTPAFRRIWCLTSLDFYGARQDSMFCPFLIMEEVCDAVYLFSCTVHHLLEICSLVRECNWDCAWLGWCRLYSRYCFSKLGQHKAASLQVYDVWLINPPPLNIPFSEIRVL